jgi:hypothetical protein
VPLQLGPREGLVVLPGQQLLRAARRRVRPSHLLTSSRLAFLPRSIYPFAYYFCRKANVGGCPCCSLDHPFKKNHRQCDNAACRHSPLSHYCWWNR